MHDLVIDLEDGRTAPMTPPDTLGAAFAAVIAETLSWDNDRRAAISDLHAAAEDEPGYTEVSDRADETLTRAGLAWSFQFGEEGEPPESSPYIDTLREEWSRGAADVAAAVLARDLRLITEADFTTLTAWWTAAGLPLPEAGYTALRLAFLGDDAVLWAEDQDDVARNADELAFERYRIPGWPMPAVSVLGMTVAEGRYAGMPGLNWYRKTRPVAAADLTVGDWLDTDDRRGARRIESIPIEQPDDGTRTVLIGGGEPVTVQLGRTYRVVDPDTLVDINVERPVVFRGGPVDGQVSYQPRAAMRQHVRTTLGVEHDALWGAADVWPASMERYAPAPEEEQDEPAAEVMVWRLPTNNELVAARNQRADRDEERLHEYELDALAEQDAD